MSSSNPFLGLGGAPSTILATTSKAVGEGQGPGSKGKPLRQAEGKGTGHGQAQEGMGRGTGSHEDPHLLLDSEPGRPAGMTTAQWRRERKKRTAASKAAAGFTRVIRAPHAVKGAGKPDAKGRDVGTLNVSWPVNQVQLGLPIYKKLVADASEDSHIISIRQRRSGDLSRLFIEGHRVGHWYREVSDLTKQETGKSLEDIHVPVGEGGQAEGGQSEPWHGAFLRELLSLHPHSQPVFEDGLDLYEAFYEDPFSHSEEDVGEDKLEPHEERDDIDIEALTAQEEAAAGLGLSVEEAGLEPKEELDDIALEALSARAEELEKGELGPEEAEEVRFRSSLKREFEEDTAALPTITPRSKKAHLAMKRNERLKRVKPTFVIQTAGFRNMAEYYPEQKDNWNEANRLQLRLGAKEADFMMELTDGRLMPMNNIVKDAISGLRVTGFSLYVCMYVYGRAFCCAWS